MKAKEFFDKVASMRYHQKQYFASKDPSILVKSKELEREIDAEIKRVQNILDTRKAGREPTSYEINGNVYIEGQKQLGEDVEYYRGQYPNTYTPITTILRSINLSASRLNESDCFGIDVSTDSQGRCYTFTVVEWSRECGFLVRYTGIGKV